MWTVNVSHVQHSECQFELTVWIKDVLSIITSTQPESTNYTLKTLDGYWVKIHWPPLVVTWNCMYPFFLFHFSFTYNIWHSIWFQEWCRWICAVTPPNSVSNLRCYACSHHTHTNLFYMLHIRWCFLSNTIKCLSYDYTAPSVNHHHHRSKAPTCESNSKRTTGSCM